MVLRNRGSDARRGFVLIMKPELTAEYAKECFDYNPDTGILTWKERPRHHFPTEHGWKVVNGARTGFVAGSLNDKGYLDVRINGRLLRTHRIIWIMHYGAWPVEFIDHINGIKTDNRICNLREATLTENNRNSGISSRNTSGVKGVRWHKGAGKWMVSIKKESKDHYLGLFTSIHEAEAAVIDIRNILHGDFARHA